VVTNILGISAFFHDSAAALIRDGEIIAAVQEERFTRRKGDASFLSNAIRCCLEVYAIYLPKANPSGQLELSGAAPEFERYWNNPRTGEFEGLPRS